MADSVDNAPTETQPWSPKTIGIALAAYQPNPVWFSEQLTSIVHQTHTTWICVITLDSPLEEIRHHPSLAQFLTDSRFTWIENNERLGIRLNFEKAMATVVDRGVDLVAFCDQDDIWLPEKLEESISVIKAVGPLSLVASDAYLFAGDEPLSETLNSLHRIYRSTLNTAEQIIYPSVSGFTMLVDAELIKRHPKIPLSLRYHDHWFSVVATTYRGVRRVEQPLAFYRQHGKNSVGISSIRSKLGLQKIVPTIEAVPKIEAATPVHSLGARHREAARVVANQLPISGVNRFLFLSRVGWILVLLTIIARRSMSEKVLVIQAYRAMVAQLLMFPPQTETIQAVRASIPLSKRMLRGAVLGLGIGVLGLVGLNHAAVLPNVRSATPLFWLAVAVVAMMLPALKLAQHRYPHAVLLLTASSAVLAGAARLVTDSAALSAVAFSMPLVWWLVYRIRWRSDAGY